MNETGGKLAPAIKRLIDDELLSDDDILLIRAYLRQWIDSPVWDMNPDGSAQSAEARRLLGELRIRARTIKNRLEIDQWIGVAVEFGMDPL